MCMENVECVWRMLSVYGECRVCMENVECVWRMSSVYGECRVNVGVIYDSCMFTRLTALFVLIKYSKRKPALISYCLA